MPSSLKSSELKLQLSSSSSSSYNYAQLQLLLQLQPLQIQLQHAQAPALTRICPKLQQVTVTPGDGAAGPGLFLYNIIQYVCRAPSRPRIRHASSRPKVGFAWWGESRWLHTTLASPRLASPRTGDPT